MRPVRRMSECDRESPVFALRSWHLDNSFFLSFHLLTRLCYYIYGLSSRVAVIVGLDPTQGHAPHRPFPTHPLPQGLGGGEANVAKLSLFCSRKLLFCKHRTYRNTELRTQINTWVGSATDSCRQKHRRIDANGRTAFSYNHRHHQQQQSKALPPLAFPSPNTSPLRPASPSSSISSNTSSSSVTPPPIPHFLLLFCLPLLSPLPSFITNKGP